MYLYDAYSLVWYPLFQRVPIHKPSYVLADSHSGLGEEQKVNFESMDIEKHTARSQAIQEEKMITPWPLPTGNKSYA